MSSSPDWVWPIGGRARGRALIAGLAGAMATLLLVAGVSMGGGSDSDGGESRPSEGLGQLKELRTQLQRADDHRNKLSNRFEDLMDEAQGHRRLFLLAAFNDYSYLDECNASALLQRLNEVDNQVASGYYEQGLARHLSLKGARTNAREAANMVNECAPESYAFANVTYLIVQDMFEAHEDGKVRDERSQKFYLTLRQSILNRNRRLIASAQDQVKGGCDVPRIHREVTNIGVLIAVARSITPDYFLEFRTARDGQAKHEADESARKGRRALVGRAQQATNELIRYWQACSPPACADEEDNDNDGTSDAGDIGCKSGAAGAYVSADESENKSEMPNVACPPVGTSTTAASPAGDRMINVNEGDELSGIVLHNAATGQVIFERHAPATDLLAGGPVSLGDAVCGPGTTTTVSWRVERTTVTWNFAFVKEDKDVAPVRNRIIGVANTR